MPIKDCCFRDTYIRETKSGDIHEQYFSVKRDLSCDIIYVSFDARLALESSPLNSHFPHIYVSFDTIYVSFDTTYVSRLESPSQISQCPHIPVCFEKMYISFDTIYVSFNTGLTPRVSFSTFTVFTYSCVFWHNIHVSFDTIYLSLFTQNIRLFWHNIRLF